MTSNTLKVECASHCTTPSERPDSHLVAVKVGCLHVNPATPKGRRKFLLQMLLLCFVPHAALIIQNSTIMAQLSQTLDSALYLKSEVETIMSLGQLIMALQDERMVIIEYLFQISQPGEVPLNRTDVQKAFADTDNCINRAPSIVEDQHKITLYHFRNDIINFLDLKRMELYKRISIYDKINSVLLLYTAHRVKTASNAMWRQLSATQALLKAIDEISISLVTYIFHVGLKDMDSLHKSYMHLYLAVDQLTSAVQYLKLEKIIIREVAIIEEITTFYRMNCQHIDVEDHDYIEKSRKGLVRLHSVHDRLMPYLRNYVSSEMWVARRTLGIGVLVLVVVVLVSPLLVLLLRHTVYTIQTFTHSIETSTQRLVAEKQKSDMLLSRMLPLPVLKRLRAQRTVPAESFDAVTIFFSDIVGFTTISANSTPMEVINMLNMLYRLFDEKIMQHNVYKVETIGDAYMVVSGLPQRNGNRHASEIADMSLSLMRSLDGAAVPHRPHEPLRIRAGINTGPCVAGVVGTTMPRYCLFGDTINTASRMESTGEAMKIHISNTTKKALDDIGNYETVPRGIVDIAGKGTMETFWLVGKIGGLQAESPRCRLHDYDQSMLEMIIGQ